jgi:8-oxo-dGTP diphosphatase
MINCTFEDGGRASLRHVIVDTLVLQNDKILMVKRTKKLLEGEKWGLVGGFVNRDETTAQAAEREIMEETGWKVKDLTLLRVNDNPNRPHEDRQNVAFVFFATATEKTGKPDWESSAQEWFDLNDVPAQEQIAFDHASSIKLYKKHLSEQYALPVVG